MLFTNIFHFYTKQTIIPMSSKESNIDTTEGFDLDAISKDQSQDGEVIYELGGGATFTPNEKNDPTPSHHDTNGDSNTTERIASQESSPESYALSQAEEYKGKGNECFQNGCYLDAIDYYTQAIDACPGTMTGQDLLDLKAKHEEAEREKANQRYQRDTARRMVRESDNKTGGGNPRGSSGRSDESGEGRSGEEEVAPPQAQNKEDIDDDLSPKEFIPPPHEYGKQLSIYYSNKAACLIQLENYQDAIQDCDLAIMVNHSYVKAYIRRMTCYEKLDQTDEALRDAKKALEIANSSGSNAKTKKEVRSHVSRLEAMEAERMEKLKEETMGKLKDLGNSILGNFGMSLDNFKAEKDPNTGSYSIRMV